MTIGDGFSADYFLWAVCFLFGFSEEYSSNQTVRGAVGAIWHHLIAFPSTAPVRRDTVEFITAHKRLHDTINEQYQHEQHNTMEVLKHLINKLHSY